MNSAKRIKKETRYSNFDIKKHHRKRARHHRTSTNAFYEACMEAVNREQPPIELLEESKEKGASFPETETSNSGEGADPFEYKVLFDRYEDPSPEVTVPTTAFVKDHNMFDRNMFIVLLIGMCISIFGWVSTCVVYKKVLWSSTQEKLELQERLRQYEQKEQHP